MAKTVEECSKKALLSAFCGECGRRVLRVENTWKHVENPWICRHFSLVGQGKPRKTREKRGLNEWTKMYVFGLKWMQMDNCFYVRLMSFRLFYI